MKAPRTLSEHLALCGIRHFDSEEYWAWGGEKLGRAIGTKIDRLRKPLIRANAKKIDYMRFYNYTATLHINSVVHSMKAGAIAATGEAVSRAIEGRKRVLDLGCNTGMLSTWYAHMEPARVVLGVDISGPCINTARQLAEKLNIGNVSFVESDIEEGIPGDGFDAIVDSQTLQYLRPDPKISERLKNALTPGGILVSVCAIGKAEECGTFLSFLQAGGLGPTSFSWIYHRDLGETSVYPVILAEPGDRAMEFDLKKEYQRALQSDHGEI